MCGIAGAFFFDTLPQDIDKTIERVKRQMTHRGPDAAGVHRSARAILIHTRLSIIDLDGGDQPLTTRSNKRLNLVANGEVYNYVELLPQLKEAGFVPRTGSDCESILGLYATGGTDHFDKLHGMYAFALVDDESNQLVLGRDRLGIKPLYYTQSANGIFFASEIKALLPFLEKSVGLDPEAFSSYLDYQFATGENTLFQSIKQVLPGQIVIIQNRQVQKKTYWTPKRVPPFVGTFDTALKQFDGLFEQVMQEHIRSDVPFGLFLSGGIDSSILLAKLTEMLGRPIKTYSVGFEGSRMSDELVIAERLAEHFRSDHSSYRVTRDQLFDRIVHSIWAADSLMRDYAILPTSLLSEYAAKDVKVVFSGEGGDEAFAGYRRYAPSIENTLKNVLMSEGGVRSSSQWNKSLRGKIWGSQLKRCAPRKAMVSGWKGLPSPWTLMQKKQYLDLTTALPDNLFVKADRAMMAFGLEGRVPLADHRLVEFGLSLPDKFKYQNKKGKWLLRTWASKHLPQDIHSLPKKGFYVPVNEWLQGEFLDLLSEKLPQNQAVRQWFNPAALHKAFQVQQSGRNASREIWSVMQFAIWHHLFVENPGVIPSPNENPIDWI